MKFSEVLEEYLELRDQSMSDDYWERSIKNRHASQKRRRELGDELDKFFSKVEDVAART